MSYLNCAALIPLINIILVWICKQILENVECLILEMYIFFLFKKTLVLYKHFYFVSSVLMVSYQC